MDDSIKIYTIDLPTRGPARNAAVSELTPLQLEQGISRDAAGALNDVHGTTFERAFPHLVRKIGPRRKIVKLRDALNPTPHPRNEEQPAGGADPPDPGNASARRRRGSAAPKR